MGGGGGGNNSSMIMMMIMMQEMQRQREEQARQIAADNLKRTQGYEKTNAQRYQTLIADQNKKMSGLYDDYNKNIDEILKIDPTYTANKKLTYNPYAVDSSIDFTYDDADPSKASQDVVDKNISSIDDFYGKLDKQSFEDYNAFKKTLDQSNTWLAAAKQKQDILGRNLPGAPPEGWGGGGGMVSGNAGADANNQSSAMVDALGNVALNTANTDQAKSAGTGFLSDPASAQTSNLSGVFKDSVAAPSAKKNTSGYMF